MKVYIDELPKSCEKCPCFHIDDYCCYCNLNTFDGNDDFYKKVDKQRHPNCSLQSLTDYTKQVRKELLQEIDYSALIKMSKKPDDLFYKDAIYESFKERLDQIQGETK